MVDDTSTDDLDEEIKQLEEELASLEEDEEEEPEAEKKGSGLKDRVPFLGGSKTEEEPTDEPDEAEEASDEAPAGEDDDEGPVGRLLGRFKGSDEDEEADEEPLKDDEPAQLEDEATVETPPPEEEERPEQEDAEETAAAAPAGALAQDPPGASEETDPRAGPPEESLTAQEKRESPRWERTEDGWRRREPDEVPEDDETPATAQERPEGPVDDEDEDGPEPRSLLARFRGGSPGDEDPEAPPPEEHPEDDDDGGGPLLLAAWILLALLAIAILAAGAYWLLGQSGEDVTANLESDALDEDGTLIAATGTPITFDASGSTGPVATYEWDFGDGESTTTEEPTATHTYDERGSYTVTITVSGDGSSDEATRDVRVVDAPTADPTVLLDGDPVADPGTVGNNAFLGDTLTLDGTASSADEEQEITTYEWDITGDGSPDETGEEATATLDEPGAWEITLTVTDDLGNTGSQTVAVHVGDRHLFEETMPSPGLEDTEGQSQRHNTSADLARGVGPVQLEATLTYGGDGDVALEADLDLSVESPAGTVYEAEDDEGDGEETLTVTSGEIDSLGEWSWIVSRDAQGGLTGSASEVDYELTVEIVY